MSAINIYANKSCASSFYYKDTNYSGIEEFTLPAETVYLSFLSPDSIKNKEITGVTINIYAKTLDGQFTNAQVWALKKGFIEQSVTYNNSPDAYDMSNQITGLTTSFAWKSASITAALIKYALDFGLKLIFMEPAVKSSKSASYKPYLGVTYSAPTPLLTNLYPASGTLASRIYPITFSWSHYYSPSGVLIKTPAQKSAKLRYRVAGAGTYTEKSIAGATNSYTLAANTLTTDSSEWQVAVTDENGQTVTSAWTAINTQIAPNAPTILYPTEIVIDVSNEATFAWKHNFTSPQDGAQVEFNYGYKTETIDVDSSEQYIAPPNSVSWAQSFSWRVRTQTGGVWGAWSAYASAEILAPFPQPSPFFSVEINNYPVSKLLFGFRFIGYGEDLNWSAFRVKVGDYDSGILDALKSSRSIVDGYIVGVCDSLVHFMNTGENTIEVQCCGTNGAWSSWGKITKTVVNDPTSNITGLSISSNGGVVSLSWGETGISIVQSDYYVIFRDGVMIGKATEKTYTDNFAGIGTHSYVVRGISNNDVYHSTDAGASVSVAIEKAILTTVDSIDWLTVDILSDGTSGYSLQASGDVTLNYYQGRQKPVPSFQDFRAIVRSFPCAFRNSTTFLQDIDKFISMLDKVVFMALPDGVKMFGVIQAPSFIPKSTAEFSFKVIETDYSEAINYE